MIFQDLDVKNIAKNKMTPMEFGAFNGHIEIVKFIIKLIKTLNPFYQDIHLNPHSQQKTLELCTPLHCASSKVRIIEIQGCG